MAMPGTEAAAWRTDYPTTLPDLNKPWLEVDFRSEPRAYMQAVVDHLTPHFRRSGKRLVGTGSEPWWISLWLDFDRYGREPLMGLTKERGPDPGDLSPTNSDGFQVWAVGFYNDAGALRLGEIFADPCDPAIPSSLTFPEGTASVKFLFTDAPPGEVAYLAGGPEYDAMIDPEGSGSASRPVADRKSGCCS